MFSAHPESVQGRKADPDDANVAQSVFLNKEPHELSSILCEVEGREGVGLVMELSPQKLEGEHDFF